MLQVLGGKDFYNARKRFCFGNIQRAQDGRRHAGAQYAGEKKPFKLQIVGEFGSSDRFCDRIRARERFSYVGEVLLAQRNPAGLNVTFVAYCLGGSPDGREDGFIAATSADDVIHRFANLVQTGVKIVLQKGMSGQQLPGCAEAALDGTMSDESFLEWMQRFEVFTLVLLVLGAQRPQTFDGQDRFPIHFGRAGQARSGGNAVDKDSADVAASFATTDFSAGQAQTLAQQVA